MPQDSDFIDRLRFVDRSAGDVTPAERQRMLEVITDAFDGWATGWYGSQTSPAEHLEWKIDGPPGMPSRVRYVELDGEMIGASVRLHHRYLVRGEVAHVNQEGDYAVLTRYQGRGVYSARPRRRRGVSPNRARTTSGIRLSVATTQNPIMRHILANRHELGNRLDVLVRVVNPIEMARARGSSRGVLGFGASLIPYMALHWYAKLRTVASHPLRGSLRLRTIDRFDDRVDAFFDNAARPFDFIQVRDRSYLNWRYCDPRSGAFTVRVAEEGGELVGYAASKTRDESGVLADLLAVPNRLDVVQALLEDAIDSLTRRGAAAIRCWLPRRHPYRGLMRGLGFVRSRRSTGFTWSSNRSFPQVSFLMDERAAVHIMQGDTDTV